VAGSFPSPERRGETQRKLEERLVVLCLPINLILSIDFLRQTLKVLSAMDQISKTAPRSLKYSSALRHAAPAAMAVGGLGLLNTASAALITVPVNQDFNTHPVLSFNPIGSNFESSFNSSVYPAYIVACGLNLGTFDDDFEWAGSGITTPTYFLPGDTINDSFFFAGDGIYLFSTIPAVNFFGYRFFDGSDTFYGYVQITTTSNASIFTVDSYTFNSVPNEGITVVPEPSAAAAFFGLTVLALVLAKKKVASLRGLFRRG
jgi:hypothetical protein